MKKNNKHINVLATWILVLSLSTHFFFIHGMFDFSVVCFEENGETNIEHSIDGKTGIDHNRQLSDNIISFTAVEKNDCKDVSQFELNHDDDRFVVKKINKPISNAVLIFSSPIYLPVKQNFTKVFNNFNTIQSNSIQRLRTVSLLI